MIVLGADTHKSSHTVAAITTATGLVLSARQRAHAAASGLAVATSAGEQSAGQGAEGAGVLSVIGLLDAVA